MSQLVHRYSKLISLVVLLLLSLDIMAHGPFRFDKDGRGLYNLEMDLRGHSITGITVMQQEQEELRGTVVNQMGLKAFDFIYNDTKQKVELHNVIKMMNRWYIRRVLRRDLRFLFSHSSSANDRNHALVITSDTVRLQNTRQNINYLFTPLTHDLAK